MKVKFSVQIIGSLLTICAISNGTFAESLCRKEVIEQCNSIVKIKAVSQLEDGALVDGSSADDRSTLECVDRITKASPSCNAEIVSTQTNPNTHQKDFQLKLTGRQLPRFAPKSSFTPPPLKRSPAGIFETFRETFLNGDSESKSNAIPPNIPAGPITSDQGYVLELHFNNIGDLKTGAPVKIAGVQIGQVESVELSPANIPVIKVLINNAVKVTRDAIFSVRHHDQKTLIPYISINQGAESNFLKVGDTNIETESAVELEDIIGKILHECTR